MVEIVQLVANLPSYCHTKTVDSATKLQVLVEKFIN